MMCLIRIRIILFLTTLIVFVKCSDTSECVTYASRKDALIVKVQPKVIDLGEVTTLSVKREKFHLPKFRVFIGDYDEDFNLPKGVEPQYFEDTDSLASLVLQPETVGIKHIRGIVEEYVLVSKDSIDSYRYPFEIKLEVRDTVDSI